MVIFRCGTEKCFKWYSTLPMDKESADNFLALQKKKGNDTSYMSSCSEFELNGFPKNFNGCLTSTPSYKSNLLIME